MNRRAAGRASLLAMLIILAVPGMEAGAADEPPRDPQVVRQKLADLRSRMSELQKNLAAETRQRDALAGELAESEEHLAQIARDVHDLDAKLDQVGARLDQLEKERTEHTKELDTQRARLAESVRSAFLMGREQRLKLLLNQEDVAAAGRVMAYYRYLHQARVARINDVVQTLETLNRVESDIADRRRELTTLRGQRASELERERAALADRHRVLASIRERIKSGGEQMAALKRDEAALQRVLSEIQQALADIPSQLSEPFAKLKGRLDWPLARVGKARAEGGGVLMQAKPGTEVRAVAPGRVAYADWLRGYGLLVILDHGDGFMSLYAHNHTIYKSVGDWVSAGEALGQVGASGGRAEPALYFEIRHDGKPVPALSWLSGKRGM